MKPYVVKQADLDAIDSTVGELDESMESAMDNIFFHMFPTGAPADMWPEGATEDDVKGLIENPVKSLSFAMRQNEEVTAGIGGRMCFAFYRMQLVKAIAAEPGSPASLYSTVLDALKDWIIANTLSAHRRQLSTFFVAFHMAAMGHAAELAETVAGNIKQWTKTNEICDKYGIDFDAIQAGDTAALAALELASVNEMSVNDLMRYVFVANMTPGMNQDAVTAAKERLAAAQAAAGEGTPGGGDGNVALGATGSFEPKFGGAVLEDSVRA